MLSYRHCASAMTRLSNGRNTDDSKVRTGKIETAVGHYCDTTSGQVVNRWNVCMTLIMDIGLLFFLFMGLWRWSYARTSSSSVWHLLWNQVCFF